jgi:hypothetical protein
MVTTQQGRVMRDSLRETDSNLRGSGPDANTVGSLRGGAPRRGSEQFADYYPVIAQAVDRLKQSTAATRQIIYDRERLAMTAQLRDVAPPLGESVVSREQLALERAIRKVETESIRLSPTPLGPDIRKPYPAPGPIPETGDEQLERPRSKVDEDWIAADSVFAKRLPVNNPDLAAELETLRRDIRRGGRGAVMSRSARTLVSLTIMGLLIISVGTGAY